MFDPKALRLFLDVLSDAVLVLDRGARVYFANTNAASLLGAQTGMALTQFSAHLGEPVTSAVLRVLSKGVAKLGVKPTVPPTLTLPDGRMFSVALAALEGERWALRLAPMQQAAARPAVAAPPPAAISPISADPVGVFWDSPFPVCVQDEEFRIVRVNRAYSEFTGLRADELLGRDTLELQPQEDREMTLAFRRQVMAMPPSSQPAKLVDRRITHTDGRERWYRAAWRMVKDERGKTRYISVLQDTTAEHSARDNADRSLRELDDWFDLSPAGMVLYDDQGLLIRSNPAFEAMVNPIPVLLSDADRALQQLMGWLNGRPVAGLEPGAAPIDAKASLKQADGTHRLMRSAVRCYRTATQQLRFMAVVEDRSIDEASGFAQAQVSALMDAAGVGLATFRNESGWVQLSSPFGATEMGDLPTQPGELHSIDRELVVEESRPEFDRLQEALRTGRRTEARYAIRHPEQGMRWLLTRLEPARAASDIPSTSVVTLDITEQQQAQQRSETLLREMTTILEGTTVGVAYLRGNMLVRCNSCFALLLGFSAGQLAGCVLQEVFAAQAKALELLDDIDTALEQGAVFETELHIDLPDKPRTWCTLTVRRSMHVGDGGEVVSVAVLADITRLKSQQQELESLARGHEQMFNVSEVGIAFIRERRLHRVNDSMVQLTGYSEDELIGMPTSALFAPGEYEQLITSIRATVREHGVWKGERKLLRKDGSLFWVQTSLRRVTHDDTDEFIASYVNVDDMHRARQSVSLQAERTRAILDSVLVGIVTVGPSGIEWMNRSARRMFGGDLADFIGQPMDVVASDGADHPFRQKHYLNDLMEGMAETFECQVKARDGRSFWVVGNAVATGREVIGRQLTYALLDIERRRQAEALTAQAQASLARLIETAPLAIALFDAASLRMLQVNHVAARTAGRSPAQLIGRTLEEVWPREAALERMRDMKQALAARDVTIREYNEFIPGGETRIWDARYLPLAAPGALPDQLLLVATDVTEQRAAQEARLEAAISQREMLVKEVHHRIKNNLQGVAGLMQQIGSRKPEIADAMEEVIGQVHAIAQVYGLQVGVTGLLRLRNVLEAITSSVHRTFGNPISFDVEGATPDVWILPEAESIPIALTVNELLTNAIKHSQPPGREAAVSCRMVCGEGGVQIMIANNGALPGGFSLARFPAGVSGLGLVRALLPRRSASLTLEQRGNDVVATVALVSPGVTRIAQA